MLAARTYSIAEMEQISGFDRRTIVYYLQQGLVPRAGRRGPNTRYPQEALLRLRFIRGLKDLQDQGRCGTVTLREIGALLDLLEPARIGVLVERGMPMEDLAPLLERLSETQPPAAPAVIPTASPPSPPVAAPPAAPPQKPAGLLGPAGERRSYGLADAGIRQRLGAPPVARPAEPAAPEPAGDATPHEDTGPRPPAPPAGPPPPADISEDLGQLGQMLRDLEVRPALTGRRLPPGASEQWTEIPITSRVFLSVRGLSQDDAPLADAVARTLKKLLRAR